MAISPFSLENSWVVRWHRIPSNFEASPILGQIAEKEEEAIKATASVGLITGSQLFHIFGLGKKKVKRMVERNRLVEHELMMNNKNKISVYSLGVNGAKIAGVFGYVHNYWVEYRIEEILSRLLFFSFYGRFYPSELMLAPDPFIGSIKVNNKPMFVYVVRGDVSDLMMYLKWNKLNERLIIVTESLSFLEELKPYIQDIKLRVTLDEDVINRDKSLKELFYLFEDNEFIKEFTSQSV